MDVNAIEDQKKDDILKAGIAEFGALGYSMANTNRICVMAEVSKGLIYHYYGTKKNLYVQSVNACIDNLLDFFNRLPPNNEEMDFVDTILKYYTLKIAFFTQNPMHYKMIKKAMHETPVEVKADVDRQLEMASNYGIETLLSAIDKLPLRYGVKRESVITLLTAVLGTMESKFDRVLQDEDRNKTKQLQNVEDECRELLGLLLYGIVNQ